MVNKSLNKAKVLKHDEFYTQKWDIEQELTHYRESLTGKAIYCNCDDPITSRFWKYFYRQFGFLQLKQLIATHYNMDGSPSYALIYRGGSDAAPNFDENVEKVQLKGNGDFRSDECIEFLKQSDVVVTNPPFSLAKEYIKQLIDYKKKFVIWGNNNWINLQEVFPLLMQRKVWTGNIANKTCVFRIPKDYPKWDEKVTEEKGDGNHYAKVPAITTFTNLPLKKSTDQVVVFEDWTFAPHPAYDNYAAFEVSKLSDIPVPLEYTTDIRSSNVDGWKSIYKNDLQVISNNDETTKVHIIRPILGVPITFMDKYNPSSILPKHNLGREFDLLGITDRQNRYGYRFKKYTKEDDPKFNDLNAHPVIQLPDCKYKSKYARILIRVKPGVTEF